MNRNLLGKGWAFPLSTDIKGGVKFSQYEKSIEESEDDSGGSLEEERRLFYVAITRAREKLYITSCKKRRHLQSESECNPSPFLEEIPSNLIKIHEREKEIIDDTQAQEYFKKMKTMLK